ncbi:hypothetical protein DBR32_02910 [Taibaiella sp. KBW10]|uniref:DUF6591 domain-containing protein n=1 Tax=Taibaiella sp. KBW10 TaxID=2153357 RepID=UPI000F5B7CFC|nr:DUF6591 domain-containing protein [Taibaiella sp. KBW10]RQO32562.1 hypothetical protein DBR32_02910 [Taibaiella sp. KBW10]
MKKIIIPALMLGLFFASCKNESSSTKETSAAIKPQSTKINGPIGDYYEVIDKEYKIDDSGMFNVISVTIKRKSANLPFEPNKTVPYGTEQAGKSTHIGFGIELLDEKGNSLEVKNASESGLGGVFSSDDIISIINLQNGETATVRWSVDKELTSKVKSFKITSAIDNNTSTEVNDVEPQTVTASSSNNEELLRSYEEFIDGYISALKKVKAGDVSVMNEYPKLMEKAQAIDNKIKANEGELTKDQLKRYIKLQTKMSNAMVDMM